MTKKKEIKETEVFNLKEKDINMSFLPDGEREPVTSNYMKFETGENTFRVLSSAVVGNEFWVTNPEDKTKRIPVRRHMNEEIAIEELETRQNSDELDMPKYFWSFVVYNRGAKRIQILHLTQATIRKAIKALTKNKAWGDPKEYDITVTRQGEGLLTEYTVMPSPKEKIDPAIVKQYKAMEIDLEALFKNEDPFSKVVEEDEKI